MKRRLTRPEPCGDACVDTPRLLLQVVGEELRLVAEVHAQADSTWRVPGPLGSWVPASVTVDGAPAQAMAQQADAFLFVRLAPGVHRLEARGPLPPGGSFTLELADRPRQARAEAPGWEVAGLRREGPPDASLQLSRRLPGGRREAEAAGAYAPWLQVTRTVSLGISWRVTTAVVRLSPPGAPLALRVPLLPGEAPSDATLTVEGGAVAVSLGRDQMETVWSSTLEAAESLTLTAPKDRPWSEVWRVRCGPAWDCAGEGLAPVAREADQVLEPQYRPWPGETLTLRLRRPAAVEGQTLTLDQVELDAAPGSRQERATLSLRARSSREQALSIVLPESAQLQQLTVDGAARASRPEQGRLSVTVPAGTHQVALVWQQERGLGFAHALPVVSFSAPAANVSLQAGPASGALAAVHVRAGLGPGGAVLAVPDLPAGLGLAAGAPAREPAHQSAMAAAGPGPQPDVRPRGAVRGRVLLRAGVAAAAPVRGLPGLRPRPARLCCWAPS